MSPPSKTIRIALCDDEASSRAQLAALLTEWAHAQGCQAALFPYESGEALLMALPCDVVFLDIQMKGQDGLAIARALRKQQGNVPLVFTTSFQDYAVKGYEVQALRYLVKPVQRHDLFPAMDAAAAVLDTRQEDSYLFRCEGTDRKVRISDIYFFEIFSHDVEMHTAQQVYTFAKKLQTLERELPDCFVRNHRSSMVNIHHVYAIKSNLLELDNSRTLPVSDSRRKAVQEAFLRFRVQ